MQVNGSKYRILYITRISNYSHLNYFKFLPLSRYLVLSAYFEYENAFQNVSLLNCTVSNGINHSRIDARFKVFYLLQFYDKPSIMCYVL